MNKTTEALKLAEEALNAMLTHMGMDEDEWTKPTFDQSRKTLAAIREALAEPVKQEPVACQDSDDRRLLREVFMLCEATEEIEATNDFMRGRVFEAKGIRRGIGTWYQDTFCGRSYMGEPVIPAAPVSAKREWVDLPDYEMVMLYAESPMCDSEMIAFAHAVIAAFKEKNK